MRYEPARNGEYARYVVPRAALAGYAALDERALILAGLPHSEIDEGVEHCCNELLEAFEHFGLPKTLRHGFTIASADIVRERTCEGQSQPSPGSAQREH